MSKAKIKSEVEQAIAKCRAHLGDVVGYSISVGRAGVDPVVVRDYTMRLIERVRDDPQAPGEAAIAADLRKFEKIRALAQQDGQRRMQAILDQ